MGARRLIYFLLALMPVFFTASVAVGTRMTPSEWITPEFGPDLNEALSQYAPLLAKTTATAPPMAYPDAQASDAMAEVWLTAKLPSVATGNMPVVGQEGPFYEIQRVRQCLASNLVRIAKRSHDAGDHHGEARRLGSAMKIAEVAKYSSLNSISSASDLQREVMRIIEKSASTFDTVDRKFLAEAISFITIRPQFVGDVSARLMAATKSLYSTAKALKRYAANEMVPVGLSKHQPRLDIVNLSTEELTVAGLADAAMATTKDLEGRRDKVLKVLAH